MDRFIKLWKKKEKSKEEEEVSEPPESPASSATHSMRSNAATTLVETKNENQSDSKSDNPDIHSQRIKNDKNLHQPSSGRTFQDSWKITFPWLESSREKNGNAICRCCTKAVLCKLFLPSNVQAVRAREAFVEKGFNAWARALTAFRNHESSEFHRDAVTGLANIERISVLESLSADKQQQMKKARIALEKIFETVNFLGQEGFPLRGHRGANNDERSKFMGILKLRANDVPELNSWLNRTSGYKWLHHDTIEEILKLQADAVLNKIISEVKEAKYFSLMIDETSDISRLEQVSVCFRFVSENFEVREEFIGFYQTSNTKSETLYAIVTDILLRFSLSINNLRGQCFDGASNVGGRLTGLQKRIRDDEPRALHVHCTAHRLNLVVQDALQNITFINVFIGLIKDLINFVRNSPKRLAFFKELQDDHAPVLTKYCPTRWCVRIKSLRSILCNYEALMSFFENICRDKETDPTLRAEALGYVHKLETFEFYFNLKLLISVFERVENLNQELQKEELSVNEANSKIEIMKNAFQEMRKNFFNQFWNNVQMETQNLDLEPPTIPRVRKTPRRFDIGSVGHIFSNPQEYYQKLFCEVIDTTVTAFNERFPVETSRFFNEIEDFLIKKIGSSEDKIAEFYNIKDELEFDATRLKLHRDMLIDIIMKELPEGPTCIKEVIDFLKKKPYLSPLVSEVTKLIKILLTIPMSTCTAERSFSALRRLKTYLRSSLKQERLNHVAILHVHRDYAEDLDLTPLINEWINRASVRKSTFSMK